MNINETPRATTKNLCKEIHWKLLCINQNGILKNVQVTQRKAGKIKQKLKKQKTKKSHLNLSIKVNTLNICNLNTPIKR